MHSARLPLVAGLATLCLVLAGCSSKVANTTQYSGFLSDYSKLKPSESPSGHQTLRWISPDYKLSDYRGIYYTPVVYYPAAKPNNRVRQHLTRFECTSITSLKPRLRSASRW